MSLRKDLESRLDYHANVIDKLQKQIKRLEEKEINQQLENVTMNEIWRRSKVREAELQAQIEKLQRQVRCGVQGHQLKLKNTYDHGFDTVNNWYGVFICQCCEIEQDRKLIQKEIESAKKLGFLK